jgi:uncharacterized glyoxalase superfamily protein PhnB
MKKSNRPVPEGHHTVQPYIIVPDAARAIAFYKQAFGAEEVVVMRGPDGKSVMHAEIRIGDSMLYLSDENPRWETRSAKTLGGSPVSIHLYVQDADALFKRAVAAGAAVTMEPMDAFWGDRYGKVVDPFGIQWGIATHTIDMTPEEIDAGAREFMKQMGQ